MTKDLNFDKGRFEKFLDWLDSDRETAGRKYENIRSKLIKIFYARGCYAAEELADECIDRIIKKIDDLSESYEGDPALYFYGVAKYVFLEYTKRPKTEELPDIIAQIEASTNDNEKDFRCLNNCLKKLASDQRKLIIDYYRDEKRDKINRRKAIEQTLVITNETLRIRIFRTKKKLKQCIQDCINNQPSDETF